MPGINHLNKYVVDSTTVSGSSGSLLAMLTMGFVPMSMRNACLLLLPGSTGRRFPSATT